MKKVILYLFWLVGVGELISILLTIPLLGYISKPLIMITLGLYYVLSVSREMRSNALILAIAFSFIGDVLLMLQSKGASFFILGLVAFLIAHVFYILSYKNHRGEPSANHLQGIHKIRMALPIILAGTGLVVVLYPVLYDFKFPVIVYAIVLVFMVLNALFRYGYTNSKSFWLVFSGAILFLISDSILAINKFLQLITNGDFMIMITYIVGQFLIVQGLIRHVEMIDSPRSTVHGRVF